MAFRQLREIVEVKGIPYTVILDQRPVEPNGPCAICGKPAKIALEIVVKEIHNPKAQVPKLSMTAPTALAIIQEKKKKASESLRCEGCTKQ